MDIVLFAGLASSAVYLEALGYAGAVPKLVVTIQGSRAAPFVAAEAERWRVPLVAIDDANDGGFVDRLRAIHPDLVLLAGWPDAARAPLRAVARIATLDLHAASARGQRAKEPLFWAILHDERRVALEVRRATHEPDDGALLGSMLVEITSDATSATLARAVDEAGARLIAGVIAAARAGSIPNGERVAREGRRHPPLRPEHGLLDLTRPALELERLVRASTGEILPYLFYRGVKLGVLRADVVPAPRHATPGQVVEVEGGVAFATIDRALRIQRALFLHKSFEGEALANELGIAIGSQLSNSPAF
jgi:methionyl-tRNA formyltransferase